MSRFATGGVIPSPGEREPVTLILDGTYVIAMRDATRRLPLLRRLNAPLLWEGDQA